MAEVKFENVTKRYGELEAVSGGSWTAEQGEFLVLFGPSGAGKTTTLELIAGLELPDEGEVCFNGQAMLEVDTADRNVSMAFENYALYPHMTVFQNIAFPLMVPGRSEKVSKDEITKRVTEIAEVLQIEMFLERMPRQLSGGQRQRVALGRCLIRKPEVCLLDEPIAHLDAKLRHRMYAELKRIQRERGTTTIYATPAQSEAMAMADRIVILFEGQVQQVATPRELYNYPATVAIARFGGEQPMNILPVDLDRDGNELFMSIVDVRLPAPTNLRTIVEAHNSDDKVLLGVRPPDIVFSPVKLDSGLRSELYAIEQIGRTARIIARIGEHLIEVVVKDDITAAIGDTIWLSLDESPLYLFDAHTTRLVSGTELS